MLLNIDGWSACFPLPYGSYPFGLKCTSKVDMYNQLNLADCLQFTGTRTWTFLPVLTVADSR